MRKLLVVSAVLLLVACSAVPVRKEAPTAGAAKLLELPVPQMYQQAVTQAEFFGAEIYMQDIAAWAATDFLRTKGVVSDDERLRGWVTEHADNIVTNEKMKVTFIGEVEGELKGLYQVQVDAGKVIDSTYARPAEGIQLTENQRSMFKARQLAMGSGFTACSKSYNTAVFKYGDEAASYTVVYLLAGTDVPAVMAGGNYRVLLNDKGDTILETKALSKSCLALEKSEGTAALTLSHIVEPTPNAVHVFLSLLHEIPIYVLTTENGIMWKVEGNRISSISKKLTRQQ